MWIIEQEREGIDGGLGQVDSSSYTGGGTDCP